MSPAAIPPIAPSTADALSLMDSVAPMSLPVQTSAAGSVSFSQMLTDGIDDVSSKLQTADKMVHAFALDDSIPVHQVTYALEQARLSLELMLQVRGHLIDTYQQLMNMQL